MKVYGCHIKSYIDGGAPGYFMIGPFTSEINAKHCAKALNKVFHEEKNSNKRMDFISEIYRCVGGYGYFEGWDSEAEVVEVNISDLNVDEDEAYSLFQGYYQKLLDKREQLKIEFNNKVEQVKQYLNKNKQDVSDMSIENFKIFLPYTQQVGDCVYDCVLHVQRTDNSIIEYYSECFCNGKEYDINNNEELSQKYARLCNKCSQYIKHINWYCSCNYKTYNAIYKERHIVRQLLVLMACNILNEEG